MKSVLIIDDNYESMHKTCIELEKYDFSIVISDRVSDVFKFFKIREIPGIIFLAESVKDRMQLVRKVKTNTAVHLIPIYSSSEAGQKKYPYVIKPYCGNDFLKIIREID